MSPPDLGTGLWGLAAHLYQTRPSPREAFLELTRRTHATDFAEADVETARSLSSLRLTGWYGEMQRRYAAVRAALRSERAADVEEVSEVVRSLYPQGCSASDFAGAVQTSTAMLSLTVSTGAVAAFIDEKEEAITSHGLHELTADMLISCITDELLLDALVPVRWYTATASTGSKESVMPRVRRIGLRLEPLCIAIEYTTTAGSGAVRNRRIPLTGLLPLTGPTGPLARRLAVSHGWLLSEAELQRLLIKLQHLAIKQAEEDKMQRGPAAAYGDTSGGQPKTNKVDAPATVAAVLSGNVGAPRSPSPTSSTPKKKSRKPQKADVGLLYRDPDAALDNVDLNDADDVTLQEFKDVMNEKFKANALKPGDPGYEYDRRVEVAAPTQRSAWDDDSGDDE